MSGTRFNTKLEDLASSITIVTKEQMEDFAMLDMNDILQYTANTEGANTYTPGTGVVWRVRRCGYPACPTAGPYEPEGYYRRGEAIGRPVIDSDDKITYKHAFIVGCWQTIAMIPGVSRSAASIIGGMQQTFTRRLAAEFSFFLAVPTMFAATGVVHEEGVPG